MVRQIGSGIECDGVSRTHDCFTDAADLGDWQLEREGGGEKGKREKGREGKRKGKASSVSKGSKPGQA